MFLCSSSSKSFTTRPRFTYYKTSSWVLSSSMATVLGVSIKLLYEMLYHMIITSAWLQLKQTWISLWWTVRLNQVSSLLKLMLICNKVKPEAAHRAGSEKGNRSREGLLRWKRVVSWSKPENGKCWLMWASCLKSHHKWSPPPWDQIWYYGPTPWHWQNPGRMLSIKQMRGRGFLMGRWKLREIIEAGEQYFAQWRLAAGVLSKESTEKPCATP